ncbi:MAG: transcription antitermination factor NusB [Lachnospiraceae bacterium]|nr:transcription antitermination factor NusB [Lachnospiraceae bacterium]
MTRREIREHLFVLLFEGEFYDVAEMDEQTNLYFENFVSSAAEYEIEYIRGRFALIKENLGGIDALLSEATSGWKLNRMGKVELSLLRLALFEMKCDEQIPEKVAINEAVELTKKFGGDASSGFVNGVLAKLVQKVTTDEI